MRKTRILMLTNSAFGLRQTFARYLVPILNSPKKIAPRRFFNALNAELERRAKKTVLKSKPFILHFEPTNLCNLKCPSCYTGSDRNPIPKGCLSLNDYKKVIDQLKKYLVLVRLDGAGESFLNPDIFSMIEYASRNRVITAISTNLTTLETGDLEKIIAAGLDYLIISVDGATKDTYEKIRVGAQFETVISNIKEIIRLKKTLKSRIPFIEIQFIIFEDNADEVESIKKLSAELGIDRLLIKEAREYILGNARANEKKGPPCYWLWYVLNVAWTGELKACCTSGLASPFSFGDIVKNPVLAEWNNDTMKNIRRLFISGDKNVAESLIGCKCLNCYKLPYVKS